MRKVFAFRIGLAVMIAIAAIAGTMLSGCKSGETAGGTTSDVKLTPYPQSEVMYFCGYGRCKDSADYGQFIHKADCPVWKAPDPNSEIQYQARHGDAALVIGEARVSEGPGGLWYKLEDGNWTNDLWVTELRCSPDNLARFSFTDCARGQY